VKKMKRSWLETVVLVCLLVLCAALGFMLGNLLRLNTVQNDYIEHIQGLQERLSSIESPDARPCVNCVLDGSDTPYCTALCGPTPTESLEKLYGKERVDQLGVVDRSVYAKNQE